MHNIDFHDVLHVYFLNQSRLETLCTRRLLHLILPRLVFSGFNAEC